MEEGILEVVVVQSYAQGKDDEVESEHQLEGWGARIGECDVAHQARCVDH